MESDERNSSDDHFNEVTDDSTENAEENEFELERQKNLDYLLQQAEIFSHFVTNGAKAKSGKRKATTMLSKQPKTQKSSVNTSFSDNIEEKVKVQFDETPKYINGEMRDYQIRALNWLITLYENGINGILADEMGLGKTLQTISMLGYLKNFEHIHGPHLVVAPNSTLQNWLNEINKFCPSLNGLILIGDKSARAEILQQMKTTDWDVCITSYEMILKEKAQLKRFHWQYVVVDEAHRIKNENSKLSTILRSFKTKNRLLLTGTPLQNNLHELWALLNYLLPSVFSSADDFDSWFDSDNCLKGNEDIVKRLHTILRPFMLRRIKSEVEKSLLPKIEVKLFVGLTALQRETYKKVLMKDIQTINNMGQASQKALGSILMELRKAANHPYLIEGIEPGPPYTTDQHLVDSCGKMMVLDKLLARLQSQGSRVVLFSQFVIVLNLLEDYLMWRGYKYCRLDGSSDYEDRGKSIEEFNAKDSEKFIFILSTRAGGLGINLTTADTVIIYDSDWNPQSDFQAIDRVHRIGQKKQVRVFRLITENTVDERIVQRAEIKQRLDQKIIQQGRTIDKETAKENKGMKRDMIRFGAKHILSSEGADIIDIDIDKILKHGELKTAEEDDKLSKLNENSLRNLTLEEASSVSVYQFENIDFRTMHSAAKGIENVDGGRRLRAAKAKKQYSADFIGEEGSKLITLHNHQFYSKQLFDLTEDGERLDLSYDTEKKRALMAQGFENWTVEDYNNFCKAMHKFGRKNLVRIAGMIPTKTLDEVTRYHTTFWSRGRGVIEDFHYIVKKVKQGEQMLERIALVPSSGASNSSGSSGTSTPFVARSLPSSSFVSNQQNSTLLSQQLNAPAWMTTKSILTKPKSFALSQASSSPFATPAKITPSETLSQTMASQTMSAKKKLDDLLEEIKNEFDSFSSNFSDTDDSDMDESDADDGVVNSAEKQNEDINRNLLQNDAPTTN